MTDSDLLVGNNRIDSLPQQAGRLRKIVFRKNLLRDSDFNERGF